MRQLMMKYTGGKVGTYETDFSIRNYESSDYEQMLDALVPLTLKRYDRHELDSVILLKSGVTPDSVFVAEDNGAIIGTATGYTHEPDGEKPGDNGGTLHMVSALPSASSRPGPKYQT